MTQDGADPTGHGTLNNMPPRAVRTVPINSLGSGVQIRELIRVPVGWLIAWRILGHLARHWKVSLSVLAWIVLTVGTDLTARLAAAAVAAVWLGVLGMWVMRRGRQGGSEGAGRPRNPTDVVKSVWLKQRLQARWPYAAAAAHLVGRDETAPTLKKLTPTDRGLAAEVDVTRSGRAVEDVTARASQIADAVGALEVEVTRARPGIARLAFHFSDALAATFGLHDLPPAPAGHATFGVLADGRPATLALDASCLVGGLTGSGKSGVLWALLGGWLKAGVPVRLHVVDPAGGVELAALGEQLRKGSLSDRGLTIESYASRASEAADVVEKMHAAMLQRLDRIKAAGKRKHSPTKAQPLEVLIVDELLTLGELLKKGASSPLGELAFMGRKAGFIVVGLTQAGQLDALGRIRDLIPQRVCLRTSSRESTDAILGPQAEARGAACSRIDKSSPGVGYISTVDGFARFRAAYIDDATTEVLARGELPAGVGADRGERTALYRWHDEQGELLYVGISNRPDLRAQQHDQTKAWFHLAAANTIEWYGSREEALKAEAAAIRAEQPRFNRAMNERVTRRRFDKTA